MNFNGILSQILCSRINNPMLKNLINMAQNNDVNRLEQFTKNLCKERGIDFEKEILPIKNKITNSK